jgi:hypothetical protein
MKLYVCYGTWKPAPRPGGHPCGRAHDALVAAGHHPEVIKSYGLGILPSVFNQTAGRKRAKELTGSEMVPVLELADGTAIGGSEKIEAWARANPSGASSPVDAD